jgi:hypothetical protein
MRKIDHRPSARIPGFWQPHQEIGRFHTNGETYELFLRSRTTPGPGRKPSF